jgi:CheY-like chemotaxis protein
MKILLVDDDIDDMEMFADAVKQVEPEVQIEHSLNGKLAYEALQRSSSLPNYMFVDLNMPVMGGVELLSVVKSNTRLKGIPVIIYSTTIRDQQRVQLKLNGADGFIEKPTHFNDLVLALRPYIMESMQSK